MTQRLYLVMFLLPMSASVLAGTYSCESRGDFKTPKGNLIEEVCTSSDRFEEDKSVWRLDDKKLLVAKYPVMIKDGNRANTLFALQSAQNNKIGCEDQVFLIDLTGDRPHVFSLGVTYSCGIFHWARWSEKKRSVIALKSNVQFTYMNGKVTPPEDTDTKFGSPYGYSYELPPGAQVTAFVHELPLPKN